MILSEGTVSVLYDSSYKENVCIIVKYISEYFVPQSNCSNSRCEISHRVQLFGPIWVDDFSIFTSVIRNLHENLPQGNRQTQEVAEKAHSKGFSQYSLNMVTRVSSTTLALVKSVAVASMKTFFVFRVILECSPVRR